MKNKFSAIKKAFKKALSGSGKTKNNEKTGLNTLALTKWIDFDGNIHYDYEQCTLVKAYRPKGFDDPENRKTFEPIIKEVQFDGLSYYKGLAVPGTIVQVGSSVVVAANLSADNFAKVEDDLDTLDIFKYAVNLESTFRCFSSAGNKLKTIPDGIFRNCHKLNYCFEVFKNTAITSVPKDLFKNCPDLHLVNYCFKGCKGLTQIEEGLFSSNKKLRYLRGCFSETGLTGIPEGLFDSLNGKDPVSIEFIFYGCENLTEVPRPFAKKLPEYTSVTNAFTRTAFSKGCVEGNGTYKDSSVFEYFPKGMSKKDIALALGIAPSK